MFGLVIASTFRWIHVSKHIQFIKRCECDEEQVPEHQDESCKCQTQISGKFMSEQLFTLFPSFTSHNHSQKPLTLLIQFLELLFDTKITFFCNSQSMNAQFPLVNLLTQFLIKLPRVHVDGEKKKDNRRQ